MTIFAGISGIEKEDFINRLTKKAGKENNVFLVNFEDELLNEERNPPESSSDMPTFLNSDDPKLKIKTIETNFSWIAKKLDDRPQKTSDIFLNMHLSYFKNSEFYPPLMPLYFNQLFTKFPDSEVRIITLIDDVFSIWQKIKEREEEGFMNTQLTLREILAWRSLESLRAESIKQHLSLNEEGSRRVSHYVVSIRHPFETFNNLIFKQNPKRVYLSFPISETRKAQNDIADVNKFRKKMYEIGNDTSTAIFDPVAIDELAMMEPLKTANRKTVSIKKEHRWPTEIKELADPVKWPIEIPKTQVKEAIPDVSNQIASRDYTLVDSSLFLAVYRPLYNGNLSRGVDAEIKRATNHMKKVIMYNPKADQKKYPQSQSTHPFGNKVDPFNVKKSFFEHIQKVINMNKRKDKRTGVEL